VNVAKGEGIEVVAPLPEFAGFIGVGEQLGVLLRVSEGLAKSRIIEWYEGFRVVSRGRGGGGCCSGPFLPLLEGGGASSWFGQGRLMLWGWRWGGRDWG